MHDLQTEADIKLLIDEFYKKVVEDPVIGFFFTKVIPLSWEKHIPIMNKFWCSALLGANSYMGNPMLNHIELDHKSRMEQEHFDRWLELWGKTVKENFTGPKADEAIIRAKNIAAIIQSKVVQNRE